MDKSTCYKILGIPENSNPKIIKKAFRKKAMLYHPDRNNDPSASDKFIEINEAYDRIVEKNFSFSNSRKQSPKQSTQENKEETVVEKRRRYAREEIKRREEAYRKSPQYKIDLALEIVFAQVQNFFSFIGVIFVLLFLIKGVYTLSIILLFFTVKYIYALLKKEKDLDGFKEFYIAYKYLMDNSIIHLEFMLVIQLVLFWIFTKNVVLPSWILLITTLIPVISFFYLHKQKKVSRETAYKFGVNFPLLVQLLFIISFFLSKPVVPEKYETLSDENVIVEFVNQEYYYYPITRVVFLKRENREKYVVYKMSKSIFGIKHIDTKYYTN